MLNTHLLFVRVNNFNNFFMEEEMPCIITGCPNEGIHNIGIRCRRPDTTAIWAPNTNAFSLYLLTNKYENYHFINNNYINYIINLNVFKKLILIFTISFLIIIFV